MKKVYIVIVNYNGWKDTIECLDNLLMGNYRNFQIFVVDNDSPNKSLKYIENWLSNEKELHFDKLYDEELSPSIISSYNKRIMLIQSRRNGGFASGNNIVLKHVLNSGAYVWLLNPDMVPEPDCLSELVNTAEGLGGNFVLGATVKDYTSRSKILFYGGSSVNRWTGTTNEVTAISRIARLDYISGGSFFTSSENFGLVGLLPEQYFLYWEETDWCHRAKKKGVKMELCLSAVTYDKISTSIGKGYLAEYYYTLNGLKYLKKYHPPFQLSALIFNALRIVKRMITFKIKNAKAIVNASFDFIGEGK